MFAHYNPDLTEQAYLHSQYNLKNAEFYGNIDDDVLYSYAGYRYIHGADPGTINPETPFGFKYLYGLSILIFANTIAVQIIFSLIGILLVYLIIKNVTKDPVMGLLGVVLLVLDKQYVYQTFHSFLDLPLAVLILGLIYLLHRFSQKLNFYRVVILSSLLGIIAVTKLPVTALILYLVLITGNKNLRRMWLPLAGIVALVYLIIFAVFFYYHPAPADFIKLHIDTIRLYRSYLPQYPPGQIWNILLSGHWWTWWGKGTIKVEDWWWLWPVSTFSLITTWYFGKINKQPVLFILSGFSLLYLLSNSFHVVFPRYIVTILPLLVISLVYSMVELVKFINARPPVRLKVTFKWG